MFPKREALFQKGVPGSDITVAVERSWSVIDHRSSLAIWHATNGSVKRLETLPEIMNVVKNDA